MSKVNVSSELIIATEIQSTTQKGPSSAIFPVIGSKYSGLGIHVGMIGIGAGL